ncbi:MAG TPA: bacillithiol biosynthesis cysteine-adding enzyme BshC [Bacillota bacterium]
MRINNVQIDNQNKLIQEYKEQKQSIMQYFDYTCEQEDFKQRVEDLKGRKFKRDELADVLHKMNKKWSAHPTTFDNIRRLKDQNSVVVIGGQQAGLLTGPLYTIHKVISIIQFAKQQEQQLQIPVIPVFWIAGEDHDFEEINHIHLPDQKSEQLKKIKLDQSVLEKAPVSSIKVDETKASKWLDQVFKHLQETAFTKEIYVKLKRCLQQSETYVDFFARVIFQLFPDEGLVLLDSGDPTIRSLENDYFQAMIEQQPTISKGVYHTLHELKEKNYPISLNIAENSAHLFYHKHGERILLVRDEAKNWVGKNDEVKLTTDELRKVALYTPERLSNNVVSRPVMQELLFPSLAFIAGPGEISYWSVLKPAFHALHVKMPPVLPRLSITFISRTIEKLLNQYSMSEMDAINGRMNLKKEQWLASKQKPPVQQVAAQIKMDIEKIHQPLREMARQFGADVDALAQKNLLYLQREIDFLERRITDEIRKKYGKELHEFAVLQLALNPAGALQERMWNILPFINTFGIQSIKNVSKQPLSFRAPHVAIYL